MKSPSLSLAAGVAALGLALAGCGSSGTSEDGSAGGATRTVTDATGAEVEVPAEPERVVTLHYAATQPVYDLGFMPVGQGVFEPGIVPEDIEEEIESVPVVADAEEPKLEEIAKVEPDMILAPNIYDEEVLAQLEDVAPVYTFTLRGGDRAKWTQRTEEIADALGVPEQVDELQSEFQSRQQEIADTYADVIEDNNTVGVIGAYEENSFYAWGEENMTGTLLTPLGFTWSKQENAIVEDEPEPEATLSNEKIDSAVGDADILFIDSNLRAELNPFMKDLQTTTLYKELPAVRNDRVFAAGKNTVAGYTDANYTLDRVEEALQGIQEK
ncbi:iron complex transport system substrate-binding protein [Lipingzhangella halophila]|uniref:Iron complex transport system substrate-binding protein n=1 Tax=Lipingzhangella halophila TaxID=1783352 RepID=A0A7W7RFU6_9ACTN|nr:ABC transporter substrate-binding protein [Lipingzhangella halophila]MBB4931187.1 iron complex transport system substrate-binding protein [Lipingzhangella halophila]